MIKSKSAHKDVLVWRCAVPMPLRRQFDYLPPRDWSGRPEPGIRVKLPFGPRLLIGILVSVVEDANFDKDKLRRIETVVDETPLLSQTLLRLLHWTAGYYLHPIGEVLPLGLSPCERRGSPAKSSSIKSMRLTLLDDAQRQSMLSNTPKQAALLSYLKTGPKSLKTLRKEGFQRAIQMALINKGLAEECKLSDTRSWVANAAIDPSPEQRVAIQVILSRLKDFSVHLIYGVTGSGKTEIYLQCIERCLAEGRQTLVLLPEIALTPQTLNRFRRRFNAPIAVLNSAVNEAARDRHWDRARIGEAAIILGTRSAIFTPIRTLGLIIVDEEHDPSFAQQDGLRYSARDIAVKRGQIESCPVLLGTATPSLESWRNAESNRYHLHQLTKRVGSKGLPLQRTINISGLNLTAGLSAELISAIKKTLAAGNQALVFLNRRGFANALICHDCGWHSMCQNCDTRMTLHKHPRHLRCHYCDQRQNIPTRCPNCHSLKLISTGVGTQQTSAFLNDHFENVPIIRVDSDTMTKQSSMPDLIERLESAEPMVLIGTQMLSKGHHFPHVTLVAVVDADNLLFSPDFRGEERLIQLLTQVSGRAGRGDKPGEVIIQTRYPEHPIIVGLGQTYHWQLTRILDQRMDSELPPIGSMGVLRCDSASQEQGLEFLTHVRKNSKIAGVRYIGPLPAAMARRKGLYRSQLVVLTRHRKILAKAMSLLTRNSELYPKSSALRWSVDIDPYESL